MPYVSIWSDRLQRSINKVNAAKGLFVGYNACIDFLEFLEPASLTQIFANHMSDSLFARIKLKEIPRELQTQEDFLVALASTIATGKAFQIPNRQNNLKSWWDKIFDEADEHRMGGQSGIIANLLGRLDVKTIISIPNLSPVQRRRFYKDNIYVPTVDLSGDSNSLILAPASKTTFDGAITKVNWIFEYEEGLHVNLRHNGEEWNIQAPRSNRLIIADRPPGLIPGFSDEVRPFLPELGKTVERAILSGYQYLNKDNVEAQMEVELADLQAFVSQNPDLRMHWEYASIRDEVVRDKLMDTLKQVIHSFGCNEIELRTVLEDFGEEELVKAIKNEESGWNLYQGMRVVQEKLKLKRIHVHTLGYHMMCLDKDYSSQVSRKSAMNALLFSALVGTAKTLVGAFTTRNIRELELHLASRNPVSYKGLRDMEGVAKEMQMAGMVSDYRDFMRTGCIKDKNQWVILVPSQLTASDLLKSTVGLGDSISSSAFVFDRRKPHTKTVDQ